MLNDKMNALTVLMVTGVLLFGYALLPAQEYKIGSDDVIGVTFWQQPELNTVVRVTQEGIVSLPVIGEMQAAGLTTGELSREILDKISFYNRNISQATVTVVEFNSQKVFIQGQILNPGKYAFEALPGVWDLLQEAGGPTESADLSRVELIRGSGKDAGKSQIIDLKRMREKGRLDELPQLRPGDAVNVPRLPLGIQADLFGGPAYAGKNVFYVYGEVAKPGMFPLEASLDVLEGVVLAGGPTNSANLKKVRVVVKGPGNSRVYTINMEEYTRQGTPRRFLLHPEDTIIVTEKRGNALGAIWSGIRDVVPFAGAIASIVLLAR
jgi:polysaccharide export outer membrane protein